MNYVPATNIDELDIPDNAFAFIFFDVIEVKVKRNGEIIKLKSGHINVSPMHYYGGRIMTLKEVEAKMPHDKTLILNMKDNNWKRVIKCRTGNFLPFSDKDKYIPEK